MDLIADKKRQLVLKDFVRENMREGDTVITFNWDLTFERALEEYPGDPGFLYKYSSKRKRKYLSLLKPHGSIDWFERKTVQGLVAKSKIGILDDELCYYPRFDRAENPKLASVQPVIVPPVAEKEFEFSFLKRTWRHVYRAISDATELRFIGYSLPREDQFARLVFRRAVRNNVACTAKWSKNRGIFGLQPLFNRNVITTDQRRGFRGSNRDGQALPLGAWNG